VQGFISLSDDSSRRSSRGKPHPNPARLHVALGQDSRFRYGWFRTFSHLSCRLRGEPRRTIGALRIMPCLGAETVRRTRGNLITVYILTSCAVCPAAMATPCREVGTRLPRPARHFWPARLDKYASTIRRKHSLDRDHFNHHR
jgi:hypothetical protein